MNSFDIEKLEEMGSNLELHHLHSLSRAIMDDMDDPNFTAFAASVARLLQVDDFSPRTRVRMGPTGFDGKLFRDQFLKKAKAHPVTAADKPMFERNGKKLYGKCQPKQDIMLFTNLYVEHGNNVDKALKTYNILGLTLMKRKLALYGIETGKSCSGRGQGLKHEQLSLSRIALAFPILTAKWILRRKSPGVLTDSTFFKQELPLLMQHTIFRSLIPAKQFTNDLKGIALVLNVEKSVRLAKCEDIDTIRETFGEMIELSVKYIDAAINNDIDDEPKLKVLKEAGVLDVKADGEFVLSAATIELVNKLEGIKALYALKYSDAVSKATNNKEDADSDIALFGDTVN